jgi:2-keto-4-pentenoate hydratase/2-oxohepta-3-ene-1,7-dioic acid hydratase in catechol pathway
MPVSYFHQVAVALLFVCAVNGVTVQEDDVTNMIFSCAGIVAYISQFIPLSPGDLIFTGTPAGVILGHPKGHRVWLRPGDEVAVTIEGIGTLRNRLV